MEMPSQSAAQEAKQLNITLEREGEEWIAILPPHPDLGGDDEVGFPAPSEQEALDEARAYRSIEQSKVFKFEYNEQQDIYTVTFSDKTFSGKFLAPTYRDAQKAYAEFINTPEPPKAAEPTPAKTPRKRRAANNGGGEPPREQITSGIGDKPTQLAPAPRDEFRAQAVAAYDRENNDNPWEQVDARLTRLENILRDAIMATAKALEEIKNR